MIFRVAIPNDGAAMAALHASSFEAAWDEATLQDFIASDLVLVADEDGSLNGFIIVRHLFDEAEILSLCVKTTAHQRGVGSALVTTSFALLVKLGVQKLFLEVAEDNKSALALYARTGFSQIARRKAYYMRSAGSPIDALVMSITLDNGTTTPDN
jgi:[ribosomal protein S18]-alanine N-acetyltransferase